ncbi:response regulator [Thiohalomonas denitrificans]|uniref:Two-component system, OmpR family, response regulator n=1 Tax=Thiohalomonas denitrificans TaxID=415747 RepID=A0A1G5R0K6_9GAMM|nr:response regulator [Thiohalomonas denitrificans]SCZ67021.1 two-component system, OmpR family, response regulator [Thiohalomonas denitrificans]
MAEQVDHILVVDDDAEVRQLLSDYLSRNGYRTSVAADAHAMRQVLRKTRIDLLTLDLMLPDEDGLSICRNLRGNNTYIGAGDFPVIILTARGDAADRILGLEMGADDYLAKPFEPRELLARIKGVLRRVRALPPEECPAARAGRIRFDLWTLDNTGRHLESANGLVTPLTGAEYRLLGVFLEHPLRVLSRDQIIELLRAREGLPYDRGIDMTISRLRRRLGDDARSPRLLKTVWGIGYILAAEVTHE